MTKHMKKMTGCTSTSCHPGRARTWLLEVPEAWLRQRRTHQLVKHTKYAVPVHQQCIVSLRACTSSLMCGHAVAGQACSVASCFRRRSITS